MDVKYDAEKLKSEAQAQIDSFRKKIKDVADEVLGELYAKVTPYIETDTWTNYRGALRIELENEYKHSTFKDDWATRFRRVVFVENREEISNLISSDILKRIKHLEDCRQEFEYFRYTPLGDTYQCLKKQNELMAADIKLLREALKKYANQSSSIQTIEMTAKQALEATAKYETNEIKSNAISAAACSECEIWKKKYLGARQSGYLEGLEERSKYETEEG